MLLPICVALALAADPSPANNLAAIRKRVADAEMEFRKAVKSLPEGPTSERDKLGREIVQKYSESLAEGFAVAVEIARANPKSEAGFTALDWVLSIPRSHYLPPGIPAMKLMAEEYAAEPRLGPIVAGFGYMIPDESNYPEAAAAALALVQKVAEINPDHTVRGRAVFALAKVAVQRFARAEAKTDPDADRLATAAERQFEAVAKDFGNCVRHPDDDKETLGDAARASLYELRNLRLGKVAPDISGEDLDGGKCKLSDYRGRVVMLVFWATWCGPCMAGIPHERDIFERFKDRPFALLGVNGDSDREAARHAVDTERIGWRSFWDGREKAAGPITRAWNVSRWPTVYVLDHTGVIREKYLHGKKLDAPLEKLVAAAEAAKN